jgi:hypothetical protein
MTEDTPPSDGDRADGEQGATDPREGKTDAGRVLTPTDLDITDDDAVEELEDGRFVVSPGGGPPNVPDGDGTDGGSAPSQRNQGPGTDTQSDATGGSSSGGQQSPEAARNLLSEELARTRGRYAMDIVGRFDGEPARHRTVSNDVVATFENLLIWYAQHVTGETPVDEVLDILLHEASIGPEPETPNLADLLEANGLTPEDSIADLVDAIAEERRRD